MGRTEDGNYPFTKTQIAVTFDYPRRFPPTLQDVHGQIPGTAEIRCRLSRRDNMDELSDNREVHRRPQNRGLHNSGKTDFATCVSSEYFKYETLSFKGLK